MARKAKAPESKVKIVVTEETVVQLRRNDWPAPSSGFSASADEIREFLLAAGWHLPGEAISISDYGLRVSRKDDV